MSPTLQESCSKSKPTHNMGPQTFPAHFKPPKREIPNMHKHGKAGNGALKSKSQEDVRHHNKILTLNYLIEKKKKKPQKPGWISCKNLHVQEKNVFPAQMRGKEEK